MILKTISYLDDLIYLAILYSHQTFDDIPFISQFRNPCVRRRGVVLGV